MHFVPSYVRTELKKKTGIVVDEYGNKITQEDQEVNINLGKQQPKSYEEMMFKTKDVNIQPSQKNQKKFTPINSYKPQGALIYNEDLLNSLENKFN
jgi:hypothetical protein